MQDFRALKEIDDINELYTIGREIGAGSYGAVCEAVRKSSKTWCALKIISKQSLSRNPHLPSLMMQELKALHECRHANIIRVTELMEDDEHYYIATELVEGGELFDRLVEQGAFAE